MIPSHPSANHPQARPSQTTLRFGNAPAGPAGRDPTADADDLGWDLPEDEESEDGPDDENWDPDDDSDLELDQEDDEAVGLDTDTGFDDGSDEVELDDAGEDERWTVDSEAAEELPGAEAEVISGEEYGWIGDEDAAGPEEELDSDLEDEPLPSLDDGGAEGVEDDSDLDDFELGGLPELDAASEEEVEGLAAESLEELAGVQLNEDPTVEVVPGQVWKLLPARAVRVVRVSELPGPALALASCGPQLAWAAGDGWYAAAAGTQPARLQVEAAPGSSLAMAVHDGRLAFALASPAGLFVSLDAGRSFERQRESDPPLQVALTSSSGKLRIWARNARSMLITSDDLGRSWNPARIDGGLLAFATDGERRVCALVKRAHRTVLGMSSDTGRRWTWVDAADSGAGAEAAVSVLCGRGLAVLAVPQRVSCAYSGHPLRILAPLLGAPATLLDEDDDNVVYACARHDDQLLLVRCATRGGAPPMVVTSFPHADMGEPRGLVGSYAEGGFVTLHVLTDRALVRIEASLDGDDLP